MRPATFEIPEVRATAGTDKGLKCHTAARGSFWIARSQVDISSEVKEVGDHGRLVVSLWFARTAKLTHPPRQLSFPSFGDRL